MTARFPLGVCLGILLSLVACDDGETTELAVDPAINEKWHEESGNLATLIEGAVVLDRSAEMNFDHSTINAIDGDASSDWESPPKSIEQWMLIELPGLSKVEKVGVAPGAFFAEDPRRVKEMRFEFSEDGETFDDAGTISFEQKDGPNLHDLTPRLARFVRATVLSSHGHVEYFGIPTLFVQGERVEEPIELSAAGHWQLNDLDAFFKQERNRVSGYVVMDPPMLIEGAWDGSVVRFSWVRGRSYGTGIFSVNAEMTVLNGLWWYEHWVDPGNGFGVPWFGSKIGQIAKEINLDTSQIAQLHVERDGTFPLFGLVFDTGGAFNAARSQDAIDFIGVALDTFSEYRVRLIVREYSQRDARQNMTMSEAKSASLHEGLVRAGLPPGRLVINASGSEKFVPLRDSPIHWKMYSRVDFALTSLSD